MLAFLLQQRLHALMCKNVLVSNPSYVVYNIYGITGIMHGIIVYVFGHMFYVFETKRNMHVV